MNARDKMIEYRTENSISVASMAQQCRIGESLLVIIENGGVTHPNIAKRIQEQYGLSDAQTEELMPEIHRPSSPKYDPNYFVEPSEFRPRNPMSKGA